MNMQRWMVVYFFSFEFTKLLTLFKDHLLHFFVVNMYHDTAVTTSFLKVSENLIKRNLLKRLSRV